MLAGLRYAKGHDSEGPDGEGRLMPLTCKCHLHWDEADSFTPRRVSSPPRRFTARPVQAFEMGPDAVIAAVRTRVCADVPVKLPALPHRV